MLLCVCFGSVCCCWVVFTPILTLPLLFPLPCRLSQNIATVQADSEHLRVSHEKQVQQRCDALIGQYRSIAEQATQQVQVLRQQTQVNTLESIQTSEQERTEFEQQVMERANNLIRTAKAEAKIATEKLEMEREKFAKFEVEVRRQFEAHCRNFEGQLRAKAVGILAAHSVDVSDMNRNSTLQSKGSGNKRETPMNVASPPTRAAPPSPVPSSPEDERIRKTVAELKSYMSTLKIGSSSGRSGNNNGNGNGYGSAGITETKQQRDRTNTMLNARQVQVTYSSSSLAPPQQYTPSTDNDTMIDAMAELQMEETTQQFRSLHSLY